MIVHTFVFNGFQENTYVIQDDKKNCVIVDPGCYSRDEEEELLNFIEGKVFDAIGIARDTCTY